MKKIIIIGMILMSLLMMTGCNSQEGGILETGTPLHDDETITIDIDASITADRIYAIQKMLRDERVSEEAKVILRQQLDDLRS